MDINGVLIKKLEDKGCELVGIDSSPELVAAACEPGLIVIELNACDIDF